MTCSFCGTETAYVLVSNGNGSLICDHCVETAVSMIAAYKFYGEPTEIAQPQADKLANSLVRLTELAQYLTSNHKRNTAYRNLAREFHNLLTPEMFLSVADILRVGVDAALERNKEDADDRRILDGTG